ncbi:8-amino-7-oxononanoate synthase [Stieleria sp. JC731]|uniref:aminotransferase class I/II-fold pyridoxal phosphate-dependent enzyme n=1 Tax=Pirellulaceae TaxID=2691357 RepID=UPI001E575C04|nr:8-amino-7-oxononanoate synthase [Stieleria sp. JC731]MCC9600148.1 8-amino-7-oxononanoate synthase [Stieleria sp. JC731]
MTRHDWQDFQEPLSQLQSQSRFRKLVPRTSDGVLIQQPDGRRLINFGSNDYLGLAMENRGQQRSETCSGAGASALVCGWTRQHEQLAANLAAFEQTESAVLFPSGFAACSGTIATLCREGDLILSDRLNHASLIDGCRLSRAECLVYPHRDVDFIATTLQQKRSQYKRVWIVSEAVFSMDGHVAPLIDLVDVAERFEATMIVDEAHGTGVLGEHLSGACEEFDVKDRIAIRLGTLSKAIGSQGGFVVGPKIISDYLVNHCRPLIFSTALSPLAVDAAAHFFRIRDELKSRRSIVCQHSQRLRAALGRTSDPIETKVPIVPIVVGSDSDAMQLSDLLLQQGFYVPAIRPPTVPEGTSRLRVSLSAAHQSEMLDRLINVLKSRIS